MKCDLKLTNKIAVNEILKIVLERDYRVIVENVKENIVEQFLIKWLVMQNVY